MHNGFFQDFLSLNRQLHGKKMVGRVTEEFVRQKIEVLLGEMKLTGAVRVSRTGVFIQGCDTEFDLALVRATAEPMFFGLVYDPADVLAVIEVKRRGLFAVEKETDHLAACVNNLRVFNPRIRFGYLTMTEAVPRSEFKHGGARTKNIWLETERQLFEKIPGNVVTFASTLYSGDEENLVDEGNEQEFIDFTEFLVGA